jgi:predicted DNA-binding transcriptional regulator AlpA
MADSNTAQTLLKEAEVSKQLRVSLAALRKWRVMNRGPQFLKIGSLVRYRQGDIDQWLASVPVGGGFHDASGSPEHSKENGGDRLNLRNDATASHLVRARARA